MQEDHANYGRPREPGDETETRIGSYGGSYTDHHEGATTHESPVRGASSSLSARDEHSWSALAHLSIMINLITGFGGLIAAPIVWLVYRDRSSRIAFHALQSFWYQAAWLALFAVGGFASFILTVVTLGLAAVLLAPLGAILALVPFVHGAYAAYKVNQGVDYRYPFIANMLDGGRDER